MAATAVKMGGSLKDRSVGKKRLKLKAKKTDKLSLRFAARLGELLGDRPASELATKLGVSVDAVLKWLRAERIPPLDKWDDIAIKLGKSGFRDLLPQ